MVIITVKLVSFWKLWPDYFGTPCKGEEEAMTAYEGASSTSNVSLSGQALGLPVRYKHENDEFVLDIGTPSDVDELFAIFQEVVEQGQTYPIEQIDRKGFEAYFFGQYCFVVREKTATAGGTGKVVAGFYIKSNFPGRSSHLANYGLIVDKNCRGKGIGNLMVEHCVRLAPLVGFKALYTNLVYVTNTASIKTCQKYGFTQVGRVPKAGLLKGLGYVDALQFYKDVSVEQ